MQQHHAILQAVDKQRRARHEQLSSLGFSQLVEGFNNVSVTPRRYNGSNGAHTSNTIATTSRGDSNEGVGPNKNRHHQSKARNNGGFAQPKGKGKARENTHIAFGDYVAPNEDPQEEKRKKELRIKAYGEVYDPHEETLRNDLSQNYLNTGRRHQNMLQGCELEHRFKEYPKLHKLLTLHSDLVGQHACPATYLKADLQNFQLSELLPTKFDSILIDPPLEEYACDYPGRASGDKPFWTWDETAALPIPQIANNPGFIWLWVGSGKADANGVSGLDKGRELLAKWGYRRCEDIVWLKTNKRKPDLANEPPTNTILTHTKEHCLMGIRGTVRRSTDGHFVHCNIDTDVMVWEGDEKDPLRKPPELYNLIEDFCLGTRRLELFGRAHNARPGWLTVGDSDIYNKAKDVKAPVSTTLTEPLSFLSAAADVETYDKDNFDSYFLTELKRTGSNLVPTTEEVETLRPRSPGGGNRRSTPLVPGMKSNPQGIGRHTNRAGTPSASQALEYERIQAQFQEQFVRQQQQQQLLEMERLRQEEIMQQQAFMMQQMAMMGMPPAMGGMQMGMNGFSAGFQQQNQMMSPNGQMQWQMPVGMGTGMNNTMQGSQSPVQGQGQYNQGFNNGQQQQYQQQNGMQQGHFNPPMNGMFPPYNGGFM